VFIFLINIFGLFRRLIFLAFLIHQLVISIFFGLTNLVVFLISRDFVFTLYFRRFFIGIFARLTNVTFFIRSIRIFTIYFTRLIIGFVILRLTDVSFRFFY